MSLEARDTNQTIVSSDHPFWDFGIKELWQARFLLATIVWRNVRVRYKQSILGISWVIIKPFISLVIFSVIFGRLAGLDSEGAPYPVFLFSGLLVWNLFTAVATAMGGSIRSNRGMITRVYLPRLVLPLAAAGVRLIDFAASLLILIGLVLYYDQVSVHWSILAVIPLTALTIIAASGFGLFFAPLTGAYHDFAVITGYFMQIMMYLTPVVYSVTIIPEKWRWLILLNPMTGIIDGQRSAILGRPFDLTALATSFLSGSVLAVLGLLYFRRCERKFADIA